MVSRISEPSTVCYGAFWQKYMQLPIGGSQFAGFRKTFPPNNHGFQWKATDATRMSCRKLGSMDYFAPIKR